MTILEEAAILAATKNEREAAMALARKLADEERERTTRERIRVSRESTFALIEEAFKKLEEDGFVIEAVGRNKDLLATKDGKPILRGVTCTYGAPDYLAGITLCSSRQDGRIIYQTPNKGEGFVAGIHQKMIEYFADNPITSEEPCLTSNTTLNQKAGLNEPPTSCNRLGIAWLWRTTRAILAKLPRNGTS